MEKSGLNVNMLRARNLSSVLYLLNKNENMSRKDVADALKLTPAAVSKLCNQLIANGLIEEVGEEQSEKTKVGRRKIILKLRLSDYYTLGINAQVDKITVSVVSLDGSLVICRSTDITSSESEIINLCRKILKASKIQNEKILCIALCIIGSTESDNYGMFDYRILKKQLEDKLHYPVEVENNIRAFALAQQIYGEEELNKTVLYLKWGPGIGSAISADGKIVSGNDAGIAEIGHYITRRDGYKCRCGRYGCLETEVSSMAIVRDADISLSFDEIIQSNDRNLINLIDEKTDTVALALTNTATILNADKIILFGTVFKNIKISEKLIRQCKRYNSNFEDNTIILSKLNDSISYIGPAALAAEKHFFKQLNKEKAD